MNHTVATGEPAAGYAFEALASGQRKGLVAACQRGVLSALAGAYRIGVFARNAWFDRGLGVKRLPRPVISVGNITVGGTGKTPLTLWLCERLLAAGRRPAVLSRGYKGEGTRPPDELALLARRCPGAAAVAHPDRLAGGELAISQYRADVLVLDDGFQHRRLARDLDIVLIDATCPFGYGHMLPRGLLREPPASLKRAGLIVITRADQVDSADLGRTEAMVAGLCDGRPLVRAVHRVRDFTTLSGRMAGAPDRAARVFLIAAIARPAAFARTVRDAGYTIVGSRWLPDHHPYEAADIRTLAAAVREAKADLVITTEKDAVKLAGTESQWPCGIRALRVEIAFQDDGDRIVTEAVREVLAGHASGS